MPQDRPSIQSTALDQRISTKYQYLFSESKLFYCYVFLIPRVASARLFKQDKSINCAALVSARVNLHCNEDMSFMDTRLLWRYLTVA